MATAPTIRLMDTAVDSFGADILSVMNGLESAMLDIVSTARVGTTAAYDASLFLNSFPEMVTALEAAGYTELAAQQVAVYQEMAPAVVKQFAGRGVPAPKFTTASAELFGDLARADLIQFANIGESALHELHLSLYKSMVSEADFSSIVETIRAATVGLDGKGGPMANHAYTHANTAIQQFSGEVIREAGEVLGATLWEVTGPLDGVTRDVCLAALEDPIRTKEEWIAADYWGGAPGGWNCRHQLEPVFK